MFNSLSRGIIIRRLCHEPSNSLKTRLCSLDCVKLWPPSHLYPRYVPQVLHSVIRQVGMVAHDQRRPRDPRVQQAREQQEAGARNVDDVRPEALHDAEALELGDVEGHAHVRVEGEPEAERCCYGVAEDGLGRVGGVVGGEDGDVVACLLEVA